MYTKSLRQTQTCSSRSRKDRDADLDDLLGVGVDGDGDGGEDADADVGRRVSWGEGRRERGGAKDFERTCGLVLI